MVEEVTPLQEEGKKSIVPDGAQKKWFWMMAGIIACGALIRIAAAVGNGRFWFDEIITWEIAARPWSEMGKYLAMENHPPLHYLIVAAWMRLFGAGEIVVKMSSVLAGALGIWVTGLFGKRLFGARAGLWAAGITALSTYHIFFSAEARMYPWLYLFGTLSLWMWWEMTRPHTNPNSPDYNNMIQSAAAAVPLSGESSHTVVGIGGGKARGDEIPLALVFEHRRRALYASGRGIPVGDRRRLVFVGMVAGEETRDRRSGIAAPLRPDSLGRFAARVASVDNGVSKRESADAEPQCLVFLGGAAGTSADRSCAPIFLPGEFYGIHGFVRVDIRDRRAPARVGHAPEKRRRKTCVGMGSDARTRLLPPRPVAAALHGVSRACVRH